jgi:uncharacterized protein YrzB (UPF0473 family)
MEENYNPDILSVTDEQGNEILFELLERYETEDNVYVAITEYRDDEEEIVEADFEVIILKVVNDENGDEFLEEIQDEMEYEQVSDISLCISTTKGFNNPNTFLLGIQTPLCRYADLPVIRKLGAQNIVG